MMDERFASSERMGNLNIYSYINIDFVQLFCYVPLKEESKKERERNLRNLEIRHGCIF